MVDCFIALGSNLDDPLQQVTAAVAAIGRLPQSTLRAVSPWYRSAAVGPGQQPDYINGALWLQTELQPLELLHALQAIEQAQGRRRDERWGARTLDLDMLLYGDLSVNSEELTLPHPRLTERQFVMLPLLSLAADCRLPDGRRVAELSAQLGPQDVSLVSGASSPTMSANADFRDAAQTTHATPGDAQ